MANAVQGVFLYHTSKHIINSSNSLIAIVNLKHDNAMMIP